jgi:macrolide transport system ATP-binding/permease protein
MLLSVRNLSKSYGHATILTDLTFAVNAGERIGIVGMNGIGKTTLLRVLMGQESLDSGSARFGPSVEVGYLPQTTPDFFGQTIEDLILESVGHLRQLEARMRELEALMAQAVPEQTPALLEEYSQASTRFQERGGYELDHQIDAILVGLGIAHLPRSRPVATLSGGEKARVGLAALLLRSPDLLLLDEPTNHLDIDTLEWLESYLAGSRGAVLVVSHDRHFLNRVVTQILELEEHSHQLKSYSGNYDAFVRAKTAEREKWQEDYERQQEEIKALRQRMHETARQVAHNRMPKDGDKLQYNFKGGRVQQTISRNVRAAQEELKRIEANPIPKPPRPLRFYPNFATEAIRSDQIIKVEGLTRQHDGRVLFADLSFSIAPDARILLTGPNGAGKTTLIQTMLGLEAPDAGVAKMVGSARVGYLPQTSLPDLDMTVLAWYRQSQAGYDEQLIASLLETGLFRLEDTRKTITQLSIGQRRKLEIARLMAERPNVLILDEPTNYLSLDVLEAFETAILAFTGPVIAVSHDRWFMQRFGGERWELCETHLSRSTPGQASSASSTCPRAQCG